MNGYVKGLSKDKIEQLLRGVHDPCKDKDACSFCVILGMLAEERKRADRLTESARKLYNGAVWTADRPCDALRLWTELRDAAGLTVELKHGE